MLREQAPRSFLGFPHVDAQQLCLQVAGLRDVLLVPQIPHQPARLLLALRCERLLFLQIHMQLRHGECALTLTEDGLAACGLETRRSGPSGENLLVLLVFLLRLICVLLVLLLLLLLAVPFLRLLLLLFPFSVLFLRLLLLLLTVPFLRLLFLLLAVVFLHRLLLLLLSIAISFLRLPAGVQLPNVWRRHNVLRGGGWPPVPVAAARGAPPLPLDSMCPVELPRRAGLAIWKVTLCDGSHTRIESGRVL